MSECPSVCKRNVVVKRYIELEERVTVLDHHYQLLHAFFFSHPLDFVIEILQPCTRSAANLLSALHHRLLLRAAWVLC